MVKITGPIYKFFKEFEKKGFKILGLYDLLEKKFSDAETVKMIGQLPPKEILLAQLVGTIAAPIRTLMYVLQEHNKRSENK